MSSGIRYAITTSLRDSERPSVLIRSFVQAVRTLICRGAIYLASSRQMLPLSPSNLKKRVALFRMERAQWPLLTCDQTTRKSRALSELLNTKGESPSGATKLNIEGPRPRTVPRHRDVGRGIGRGLDHSQSA